MTRIHSIDYLKFLIASCVVWAHAVLLSGHFHVPTYLFGQGLVRNAVPVFAMISGFLLHATHRKGRTARWLTVLGCAYLFWCLVYLPIWLDDSHMSMRDLIYQLIFGPLHLWYMAALVVAVAMVMAVLRLASSERVAQYWLAGSAVVLLLTGSAIQSVDFYTSIDMPLNSYRNGAFVEYPFVAMGYLLAGLIRQKGLDWLPRARVLWLILAGLAVLRLIEAAFSLHYAGLSPAAPPELPPLAVAFCATLLLAMMRTPLPAPRAPLGMISMFVYFLHYIVILTMLSIGIDNVWLLTATGVAIPALATYALIWTLGIVRPLLQQSDR
ncbi:acyltransferase family protein [Rhodobacter sp. NTK016B]|uniref:acyltransferase family protein n=1 Tax=Rhodobacter sp. NTK016B TaxID=2759676 RepID=UPI001A8C384A|nr:acyltransferase [Rhodobacter sp. NTK016B]MBN8292417.1 acyltransferase family protein [Rhodobacter sp. NTK016B]